jgi:hypothetical protein
MPWPNDPCESCPQTDAQCLARALKNRRLCHLGNPSHEAFDPNYRLLLSGEQIAIVNSDRSASAETTNFVPEATSWVDRMSACPHRTGPTGCGCGSKGTCTIGKGIDGSVSYQDCFECIRAQDEAPSLGMKASNFAKAMARHVMSGMSRVDDTTYKARLARIFHPRTRLEMVRWPYSL